MQSGSGESCTSLLGSYQVFKHGPAAGSRDAVDAVGCVGVWQSARGDLNEFSNPALCLVERRPCPRSASVNCPKNANMCNWNHKTCVSKYDGNNTQCCLSTGLSVERKKVNQVGDRTLAKPVHLVAVKSFRNVGASISWEPPPQRG